MESINIEERKKITVVGATKVSTCTNTQAVVEIDNTNLVISGNNLEVTKLNLDNKEVVFAGNIVGVKYMQKTEKVGLIKRLFK